MKKHIALIILVLFFSCKQAEKTKNSVEFKQQVEKKESEKTEIDYSEDMPTDMEYLNHNEKAIKEIDTLIIKQENLNLHLIRKTFNPKNHKIDKTKLTINGETFFGTDGDFPAYELSEIYVEQNGRKIFLENSKMYNPWFGNGDVFHHQIIFIESDNGILIFGTFSDGAGFYGAEWLVNENSSERLNLSADEKFTYKYDKE